MSTMEYRAWLTIPGLPFSDEADHERLHRILDRDHGSYGPVMTWTDDGTATQIVLATDAADEAAAADELTSVVAQALHTADLGGLYPARVEIVPVTDGTVLAA